MDGFNCMSSLGVIIAANGKSRLARRILMIYTVTRPIKIPEYLLDPLPEENEQTELMQLKTEKF